jgi:hypothetical protein
MSDCTIVEIKELEPVPAANPMDNILDVRLYI